MSSDLRGFRNNHTKNTKKSWFQSVWSLCWSCVLFVHLPFVSPFCRLPFNCMTYWVTRRYCCAVLFYRRWVIICRKVAIGAPPIVYRCLQRQSDIRRLSAASDLDAPMQRWSPAKCPFMIAYVYVGYFLLNDRQNRAEYSPYSTTSISRGFVVHLVVDLYAV